MASLSSLALKGNIQNALVRPGGYKLKAAAFSDKALKLEREASSARVLYERSESARDEVNTVLSLLDPLIYDYLSMITEGKTKYEQGRIMTTTGQEQQDAILTALAAIGICLQTGMMEHETISKMNDHLEEASTGLSVLEKDARTSFSAHNMSNLLDTMQSGPLTADLLGLADLEAEKFSLPSRPTAVRSRDQASYQEIFGEEDIYTRSPTSRKGKRPARSSSIEEVSPIPGSSEIVLHDPGKRAGTSVADFFSR